jgi:hypothetical protein
MVSSTFPLANLLGSNMLLATGYWLLATGYWLLATGYWLCRSVLSLNLLVRREDDHCSFGDP